MGNCLGCRVLGKKREADHCIDCATPYCDTCFYTMRHVCDLDDASYLTSQRKYFGERGKQNRRIAVDVDKIMQVFKARAGFDGWWDDIDSQTKEDILKELEDVIADAWQEHEESHTYDETK